MCENRTIPNGFLISLEGPEGGGKSTQATLLADALRRKGYLVCQAREPGGTPLGEELRSVVKHFGGPGAVSPEAELLLFAACRAQLMRERVLPHLSRGGLVVCDRFADSTTVYQGFVRGLDPDFIAAVHHFTIAGRWPDLTLLLDLDARVSARRCRQREAQQAGRPDRFEAESEQFHLSVREGFLTLAQRFPERIRTVPADGTLEDVHGRILEIVDHALGRIS